MSDWIKAVDLWLWSHWSTVTFVAGLLTTQVLNLAFGWLKAKSESKVSGMRESLYTELKSNIARVHDMTILKRKGSDTPAHELVKLFTSEERYTVAKKDGETFYKLKEADLIGSFYNDFRRLSDGSETHPLERADVVIDHFFTRIGENVLKQKVMKKNATPAMLARIKLYTPPPAWRFCVKKPKPDTGDDGEDL